MKTFNQLSQSAVYRADDISVSVTVCGGSYGGGSEVLIIEQRSPDCGEPRVYDDICPTLNTCGGGNEYP